MEQTEYPELVRLHEIEQELRDLTVRWAELPPGRERQLVAAKIAQLKRDRVSARIAAKRAGALREV